MKDGISKEDNDSTKNTSNNELVDDKKRLKTDLKSKNKDKIKENKDQNKYFDKFFLKLKEKEFSRFKYIKIYFKPIIIFFKKISNKLDDLAGLENESKNYGTSNKKENSTNNKKIDEKFIKQVNIAQDSTRSSKNLKKLKDDSNIIKANNKNKKNKIFKSDNYIDDFQKITKNENEKNNDENSLRFLKNLKDVNESLDKNKADEIKNKKQNKNFNILNISKKSKDKFNSLKDNESSNEIFNKFEEKYRHDFQKDANSYYNINKVDKNSDITNKEDFTLKNLFKIDKNGLNKTKNKITNNDNFKTLFGAAIFGLILVVLVSSSYYFFFHQPFQEELNIAKTSKFNELNSLYKGPLSIDDNAFALKSQIEDADSPEEVQTIDIIRPATESWRYYQNREINIVKDDFNRVMATYTANETKNVIMDVNSAHKVVAENDGVVLANIKFRKPDTVVVPILVTRLQAGAGLISVGSIVDIYTLDSGNSYNQSSSQNLNESNSKNSNSSSNSDLSLQKSGLTSYNAGGTLDLSKSPDISGVTVLAIMRSKDSGVIDANYIKTQTNVNGNITNQIENSKTFSTDVEEILRGAISGGFNEEATTQILNNYGLDLSNYERTSNLAELDVQYLLLIEVPREDVSFTINNMENLILTIPTEFAPSWMISELKSTYNS